MRLLFILYLYLFSNYLFCQVKFFSNNSDGTIKVLSTFDCSEETHSGFPSFLDIAITPNNELFGINDSLYKIDYLSSSYNTVGLMVDLNNRTISGVGLVALDGNFLLMDYQDSLYKVSTTTAIAYPIGKIGYYCAGDFAFFNDTLYLAESSNHLIQIILNASKTAILSVKDVGIMNTQYHSVYSLFTTYLSCKDNNKGLFAIESNKIYMINTQTANATFVCSINDTSIVSYGAASIYDFDSKLSITEKIPNVFTPNGDSVNDNFKFLEEANINSSFTIMVFNRWGQIVFESNDLNFRWNGFNKSGEQLQDGVYYYTCKFIDNCSENNTINGFITLFR